MTSVLADTQTITWYLLDQTKLSSAALRAVSTAEQAGRLFISAITLVEVRFEVEAGRLPQGAWEGLQEAVAHSRRRLTVLPVDASVADALAQVTLTNHPSLSGRIIAATAVAHELPMVAAETSARLGGVTTLDEAVNVAEREAILAALNQCDQHRERAANVLGISVRTLHYKMIRLAI